MTKEDEEILRLLNDEENYGKTNYTMTNQHKLDFENLDDEAYFKKYGKAKSSKFDENKERKILIYNELYLFNSQLKAISKSMTNEFIEHFKSYSSLKPTMEEINQAIESLKKNDELNNK